MPGGPAATFELLRTTPNQSAAAALLAGLDVSSHTLRDRALATLLARRDEGVPVAVLRRWPTLSDRWKAQIADRHGWLSEAIHTAIQVRDSKLYASACLAAVETRDFDQVPLLVAAAEDPQNREADLAAVAAVELAEALAEAVASPRDYRLRNDPKLQRQHMLASLERSVSEFSRHGRTEILEAFLLLAGRENAVLKRSLQAPSERFFKPLSAVLEQSSRPAIVSLLLSYLDDPHAPLSALQLVARRRDITFVRHFVRKIGGDPTPAVRANLKRIDAVAWLDNHFKMLDALGDGEQPGVATLAVASNLPRPRALETVAYILRHGKAAGRRVAAQALSQFEGPEADNLAIHALNDDDSFVRAAIAEQLRGRNVPGAINRLIQLLDSRHETERAAAEAGLSEFRFPLFLESFDSLAPESRITTGLLVKRIDPQSLHLLRQELASPARGPRKRGLEIVTAMDAVLELIDALGALLKDEDPFLRVEAVRVLASQDSPQTIAALREALLDSNPLVQNAAETALRKLGAGRKTQPAGSISDTTVLSAAKAPAAANQSAAIPAAAGVS